MAGQPLHRRSGTRSHQAWLGAVVGCRTRSLGLEHVGQTGTTAEIYRHFGIDSEGIMRAAQALTPGRAMRHLRAL